MADEVEYPTIFTLFEIVTLKILHTPSGGNKETDKTSRILMLYFLFNRNKLRICDDK